METIIGGTRFFSIGIQRASGAKNVPKEDGKTISMISARHYESDPGHWQLIAAERDEWKALEPEFANSNQ